MPEAVWRGGIDLARRLTASGRKVAVLSRGYKRQSDTPHLVVSDGREILSSCADSGDEPYLIARAATSTAVIVGSDRVSTGMIAIEQFGCDVLLLDDGFQHLKLARDLDIVLVDASRPMAQPLLPAGPMREPLSALARAGIIVFTRTENTAGAKEAIQRLSNLPIFAASTRLLGFRRVGGDGFLQTAANLGSGPFFVFCGIGNPEAFERDLQRWGIMPAGHMFFPDHHHYTLENLQAIERTGARLGAKALLTTEKDSWNLQGAQFSGLPVFVSVIDLEITGETEFLAAINGALQTRGACA